MDSLDVSVGASRRLPRTGVGHRFDLRRVGRRAALAAMAIFAAVSLVYLARGTEYGFDFRGGVWQAGGAVLHGLSPYPAPEPRLLGHIANGFITPPLLGVLGIPFSLLAFIPAVVAWNLLCAIGLVGAVRLLGVRDWRAYLVALCSFAFVASLELGQPDGLFALAAAVAWKYRGRWQGALAVAALIAVKLLAWPLLIWLLVTRRFKCFWIALASTVGLLAASWAAIGFKGLSAYPRLLAADADAFEGGSHSIVSGFIRMGASPSLARELAVVFALGFGAVVVRTAQRRDVGWFTAALLVGLLTSPVMWSHYLVVLLVPLAITGGLEDPLAWLLIAALWLSPVEKPPTVWQTWLVPLVACGLAFRAVALPQPHHGPPVDSATPPETAS